MSRMCLKVTSENTRTVLMKLSVVLFLQIVDFEQKIQLSCIYARAYDLSSFQKMQFP